MSPRPCPLPDEDGVEASFPSCSDFRTLGGSLTSRFYSQVAQHPPESPGRAKSCEGCSPALPGKECRVSSHSLISLSCPRYEEEVSLRATAENEFVALKKASSRAVGGRATWH